MRKIKRRRKTVVKNYRYDIKNSEVKEKLDKGWSISKCAILFECSKNLIKSIKNGQRKQFKRQKPLPERVCSCCGFRPVGKGLFFLCDHCYTMEECGSIQIHICNYKFEDGY